METPITISATVRLTSSALGWSAVQGTKGRRDGELDDAQHLWVSFPGPRSAQRHEGSGCRIPGGLPGHPIVAEYYRHCYEERKRRLGDKSRLLPFVGTIFPNTSYHGGPGPSVSGIRMERRRRDLAYFLVDADAPVEVKELLRRYYMRYSGPAGMTEQDDMENWNYATVSTRTDCAASSLQLPAVHRSAADGQRRRARRDPDLGGERSAILSSLVEVHGGADWDELLAPMPGGGGTVEAAE